MKRLEDFLKIHLGTKGKDFNIIGQEKYNVCWRAAVENVLDNTIDELEKLEEKISMVDDDVTERLDTYIQRLNNHINNHMENIK